MKWIKRILLLLLVVLLIGALFIYFKISNSQPVYSGKIEVQALSEDVDVYFDDYGIPHVYAQNELDAQFALGYVHAQDRLFQMEMIRRVSSGTLSEVFGSDLLDTDRFFRALNIHRHAKESAKIYFSKVDNDWESAALAYQAGVNHFIETGNTPPEFTLLGIEKRPFTPEDFYLTVGYMAFGFADAFQTDPVMTKIYHKYGMDLLIDFDIDGTQNLHQTPNMLSANKLSAFNETVAHVLHNLPIPLLEGSNSWVLSGKKTTTGKVIHCNDTHIRYSQPAVWYEAHVAYPGHEVYGRYLAGFPFPVIGHSDRMAIGLTMLQNDDVDFYQLKTSEKDSSKYIYKNTEQDFRIINETIPVKDGEDIAFQKRLTQYGPVVSDFDSTLNWIEDPVAMSWTYLKVPSRLLQAAYGMIHSKSLEEMKNAVAMIDAPGLNVMYGDAEGNIAWWAAAKLTKHAENSTPWMVMDGWSGDADRLGYYSFEENPKNINPESGFVYSGNHRPETMPNQTLHGYYNPEQRAKKIFDILNEKDKFSKDDLKALFVVDQIDKRKYLVELVNELFENHPKALDGKEKYLKELNAWDGKHNLGSKGASIFTAIQAFIIEAMVKDELGESDFNLLTKSHVFTRSIPGLFENENSLWWDDVNTEGFTETRAITALNGLKNAIAYLDENNMPEWGEIHTIEHVHPIGRSKTFAPLFNVGPAPISGSSFAINNQAFWWDAEDDFNVVYGPAMRTFVSFDQQPPDAHAVLPTGQSGHFMSPHYDDQFELFNKGAFRPMEMRKDVIENFNNVLNFIKKKD